MDYTKLSKLAKDDPPKRHKEVQPMGENVASQLEELANRGNALIEQGYIERTEPETEEVATWYNECRSVLNTLFGKKSDQTKSVIRARRIPESVAALRSLAASARDAAASKAPIQVNQTVSQTSSMLVDISNQISSYIEYSVPEDKKEEVRQLFNEVKSECENEETNWDKVKDLLKKGLDYGLKIGPELVKLASAYYNAKGGA